MLIVFLLSQFQFWWPCWPDSFLYFMYYLSSVQILTKSPTLSLSSPPTSVDECLQGPSAQAKDESTPSFQLCSMKYIWPTYPTPLQLRTATKLWTWTTLQGFVLDSQDVEALYCLLPHLTIIQLLDNNLIIPACSPCPYNCRSSGKAAPPNK
jgi:hypothetical protein